MGFAQPRLLWLLLLLVPVGVAQVVGLGGGRRRLRAIAGEWRAGRMESVYVFKYFFSALLETCAIGCALLALSRPWWGQRVVAEESGAREAVVLLDVSRSMEATDVGGSRLEWSQSFAISLVQGDRAVGADRAPGAGGALSETAAGREGAPQTPAEGGSDWTATRWAVVAFAGSGRRIVPVTDDPYALRAALQSAGPALVERGGSDLEKGIRAGLAAFTGRQGASRAIYLLSDGESRAGDAPRAAEECAREGVPIHVVGVGGDAPAPVPGVGDAPLVDDRGNEVSSRRNVPLLRRIAALSGGSYTGWEDPSAVPRLPSGAAGTGARSVPRERYGLLLLGAVLLFCGAVGMRILRWKDTL